ncbi:MAG: HDOD domain-containing protein [Gemmatimonadaceae bacterium]
MPNVSPEAQAFVRAIGAGGDLPAFVKHVRTIIQVASDLKVRVQMLEDAIVKDVALTAKVLRIANATLWNAGVRVNSVKQSIMLLGFDRVQHLSSAASVFDHLQKKAPAVEELLALSVLTANQSIELAAAVGFGKGEVAYLCGLFRNLGEVTVAVHRVSQYGQWLRRCEQAPPPPPGTEQAILGFTFEDVGVALAHQWKLPREVVNSLRRLDPSLVDASTPLHTITQLSADMTNAVYRDAAPGSTHFEQSLKAFAHPLNLSTETVMEVAQAAWLTSKGTIRTMELGGKSAKMEGRLRGAAARMAPVKEKQEPVDRARKDGASSDGASVDGASLDGAEALDAEGFEVRHDHAEREEGAERRRRVGGERREETTRARSALTRERGDEPDEPAWRPNHERYAERAGDSKEEADARTVLREIVDQRLSGTGFDLGTVTRSAMAAIAAAGYERVLLALSSEDFLTVRGRVGIGAGHEHLLRHFLVRPIASAGPLGAVLHGRTDTFASCEGTAGKTWRRDRTLYELAPRNFGVLPLVLEEKLLGCVYFDTRSKSLEMSDALREMLLEIRDHLVAAFANHRRGAARDAA